MDMNQVISLVRPELLAVIVACYVLGLFLKSVPKIPDWVIPFILLIFSIALTIVYIAVVLGEGFIAKVFIVGLIQGLLCAALAVYGNELIKQFFDRRISDN